MLDILSQAHEGGGGDEGGTEYQYVKRHYQLLVTPSTYTPRIQEYAYPAVLVCWHTVLAYLVHMV